MSRFCFNCGTAIDDSAMFCHDCGAKQPVAETFVETSPDTATADQFQNTAPIPPVQQYFQPPIAPPEPPKKNKTAVTVAVCAVILCVALIASVAILFATGVLSFNKKTEETEESNENISEVTEDITDRTYSYNVENNGEVTLPESTTDTIIDNPTGSIPYSKGKVTNGEYVNEWAGFKFRIPDEYPEVDAATYSSLNANIPAGEYGFLARNDYTGSMIGISYENNIGNYSLEEIFSSSIDLAQSMTESYNPLTYGSIEEIYICSDHYLYSTMYYSATKTYGITLMREHEGKIISIIVTADSLSKCYSFLNTFEEASPSI